MCIYFFFLFRWSFYRIHVLPLEIDLEKIFALQKQGQAFEWVKPAMMLSLTKKGLRSIKLGATHVGGAADMPQSEFPSGHQCVMQVELML